MATRHMVEARRLLELENANLKDQLDAANRHVAATAAVLAAAYRDEARRCWVLGDAEAALIHLNKNFPGLVDEARKRLTACDAPGPGPTTSGGGGPS